MGQSGKRRGRKRKAPGRKGKRSGHNSREEQPAPPARDESGRLEGSEGTSRHPAEEYENEGGWNQTFLHFFHFNTYIKLIYLTLQMHWRLDEELISAVNENLLLCS